MSLILDPNDAGTNTTREVGLGPTPGPTPGTGRTYALLGPPNAGKSTLFNGLTGGRAKIGNYPGVTVELRRGAFAVPDGALDGAPDGARAALIDLPGVTSLAPRSADARVTLEVVEGRSDAVGAPDVLIVVAEAGQLRRHAGLIAEAAALGRPMILALNMTDLAERDGMVLGTDALERLLGVPVVPVTATRARGRAPLLARLSEATVPRAAPTAEEIARTGIVSEAPIDRMTRALDGVLLHPVLGLGVLLALLFLVFQAVFAWAGPFMDGIEGGVAWVGEAAGAVLPDGPVRSLAVDGIIAGVGAVVVFLPQIVILFFFILLLEQTGYMARAAFLSDELMRRSGLHGRAIIPLLSSFACAIPGMMAARTLPSERDRITTIMVAPLMTCSARLPVYAVLIAAFIPARSVGPVGLQGLVLFALYLAGVVSAVGVAWLLRRTLTRGGEQTLVMELPRYKLPQPKDLALGLWQRAKIFLRRAGTIIFVTSVILWFLVSYPGDTLRESFAGRLGALLEPLFAPVGFTLEMVIALVPGLAAREVAVGALGTVYAVADAEADPVALEGALAASWSLPAALAFLAWFVFAPQCVSTIAVARRELNSRGLTALMVGYLFVLAYAGAGATYWIARWAGL